jgi:phosphoglycolate phosphatase
LPAAWNHSEHMRPGGATAAAPGPADKGVRPHVVSTSAIRGVLFDKDGTLVDFHATWVPAYLGVAGEFAVRLGGGPGLAATLLGRQGYDPVTGVFAADSPLLWATNEAIADAWAATPELAGHGGLDVLETVLRHFSDLGRYPPRPVGDLPALLGRLRARGLRLGVATMDDVAIAYAHTAHLGIADRLDFVAGADSGHGEKPGPGMALAFCAACRLRPDEVLVVGDTPADLAMARNAGCALAVGVLTGATPAHLLRPLADRVLTSVQELETLL